MGVRRALDTAWSSDGQTMVFAYRLPATATTAATAAVATAPVATSTATVTTTEATAAAVPTLGAWTRFIDIK